MSQRTYHDKSTNDISKVTGYSSNMYGVSIHLENDIGLKSKVSLKDFLSDRFEEISKE